MEGKLSHAEVMRTFVITSLGKVSIGKEGDSEGDSENPQVTIEVCFLGNPQDSKYKNHAHFELESLNCFMDDIALTKIEVAELITYLIEIRDLMT